jgi:hypothetical protein
VKPVRVGFIALLFAVVSGVASAQQPAAAPAQQGPPRMPHPAAGKEQCTTCHASAANANIRSMPTTHNFPVTACAMCHRPVDKAPPAVPHALSEAFAQCKTCHVANSPMGAPAPPASHANWNVAICQLCHLPRPRQG